MSSGTLKVDTPPRILVLDDEEGQRMAVRHQLFDLGTFVGFGDPRAAIAYLRENCTDAVIVDVRMPKLPVDGLWFLTQLRQFDRDLGVVLRTADTDVAIAQAGIEARAVQRVIKAEPDSRVRLRAAVQAAIEETRDRRSLASAAAESERTRGALCTALGRIDIEITVGEMSRGFIQGIVNHVTTVAGYSELLVEHATATSDTALLELTAKNRVAASRLMAQVKEFLTNPVVDGMQSGLPVGRTNACVDALVQLFANHALFASGSAKFTARGVLPDVAFSAGPARIVTGLRHVVEYCALRVQPGETVALTVRVSKDAGTELASSEARLVFNARSAAGRGAVLFRIDAPIGSPSLERLREDLRQGSLDPRVGNLLMIGAVIVDERLAFAVSNSADGCTRFELYIPTSFHP